MVKSYRKFQTACIQDMQVEFSPNEPGIPFGDNLAHQVGRICHQFGDNKNPALSLKPLFSVAILELLEVMEKGGSLIHMRSI